MWQSFRSLFWSRSVQYFLNSPVADLKQVLFNSYKWICTSINNKIRKTNKIQTWLNLLVKLTTCGAMTSLFFLFQEQLESSAGWMDLNTATSSRVNWLARSSAWIFVATVAWGTGEALLLRPGNEFDLQVTELLKQKWSIQTHSFGWIKTSNFVWQFRLSLYLTFSITVTTKTMVNVKKKLNCELILKT